MNRFLLLPCLLVALSAAQPANAEDVPRFDVALFCQTNASTRGGPVRCRRVEETQRVNLTENWDTFPKQRKHFCVQSVSFKPRAQRSYQVLAQCLDDGAVS